MIMHCPIICIEVQVKENPQAFLLRKSISRRNRIKIVSLFCKEMRQSASYLPSFIFLVYCRSDCGETGSQHLWSFHAEEILWTQSLFYSHRGAQMDTCYLLGYLNTNTLFFISMTEFEAVEYQSSDR